MSENRMKEPETLFTCKACGPREGDSAMGGMKVCADLREMLPDGAAQVDCCEECHAEEEDSPGDGLQWRVDFKGVTFKVCWTMNEWFSTYSAGLSVKI